MVVVAVAVVVAVSGGGGGKEKLGGVATCFGSGPRPASRFGCFHLLIPVATVILILSLCASLSVALYS